MLKRKLPTEIHVLDLFCGSGMRLKMLARRHPKRNFVGVDHFKTGGIEPPPNLHFVQQDVLEFLRSIKQAGTVHQVNIDYGVHHPGTDKRKELFAHIAQLLPPRGSLHVTTYNRQESRPSAADPERLKREIEAAGLKLFKEAPANISTSHSQFLVENSRKSTRLWFKKPRETRV